MKRSLDSAAEIRRSPSVCHLCRHPVLHLGRQRQHQQRPGQGRGRRSRAPPERRSPPDRPSRPVSNRSPVTGSAVVMILVARSSGAVPAAIAAARVRSQPGDQRPDRLGRRLRRAAVQARNPARQRQEGRKVQDRLAALIGAELGEDRARRPRSRSGSRTACGRSHPPRHGSSRLRPRPRLAASAPPPPAPAASIAGKVSRRRPPSKAGSMIRRWRSQTSPLVTKTDLPSSGVSPSRMRSDFGKSSGRSFSTSRTSAGSLHR